MILPKLEWNVVIIGNWNLAILSPAGIAKRFFHLPEETQIEVMIPLEGVAPIQVRYKGITVIPSADRVIITPVIPNPESFELTKSIAEKVLQQLPETPVHAIGVNFRYGGKDDVPDGVISLLKSETDLPVSDAGFHIIGRSHGRSLSWNKGVLNVSASTKEDSYQVLFNFELKSSDPTVLADWVKMPVNEFLETIDKLSGTLLNIDDVEINDE